MTTTHPSPAAGATQNERILFALESGEWVAMPELCRASGSFNVHSRISDLRKQGHNIEHRNRRDGRTVCSEYRLRREGE